MRRQAVLDRHTALRFFDTRVKRFNKLIIGLFSQLCNDSFRVNNSSVHGAKISMEKTGTWPPNATRHN
jgi:hypothetical protein